MLRPAPRHPLPGTHAPARALSALLLSGVVGAAACSTASSPAANGNGNSSANSPSSDATADGGTPPSENVSFEPDASIGLGSQTLTLSPATATLSVTLGTTPSIPTQTFVAKFGGQTVGAQFTIDKGQIATIGVGSGVLTPGALGGTATVTAAYQGKTVTAAVVVKITYVSAGDPNPPDAGASAGGFGGVGGEGEGAAATSSQIAVLSGTPTADANVSFLYPYDQTVFPQGLLPPLLQWTPDAANPFDGIYIHVTESYYEYKGYFQKPAAGALFQNHPVPRDAWNGLAYSNAGETANVQLVFSSATKAFGPITEGWKFAQGELKGTIYYNSYGTKLAYNYTGALGPNPNFGGATLAIKPGASSPELVAGYTTADPVNDHSGCRVCHSVSAQGSTLITQHGDDYGMSSSYNLTKAPVAETVPAGNNGSGRLAFPGISPDGTFLISNAAPMWGEAAQPASALFSTTDGMAIASTGLGGVGMATPSFSPDGTHVAYNAYSGPGADQRSLAAMDYAAATHAFSNPRTLWIPPTGAAYSPAFLPTNDAVIFQLQAAAGGTVGGTQNDSSDLWWLDLATKTATRLDMLNGLVTATGKPYLPPHATAANPATSDLTLDYAPTVNPVVSGGYAWVVFTSRRLYGNVATINPFWSDPRANDISATPTTKKLWVAAIDLNAKPGTDPSHPAFYLPGQELLAGNSRGYWVVDPCQKDGTSCVTGDECCGGYCRPSEDGGGLTCTATQPACAEESEKCTTTADCCSGSGTIQCIGGFCSQPTPK
jgi:hypothetical protein